MAEQEEAAIAAFCPQAHIIKLAQWNQFEQPQHERQRGTDNCKHDVPSLRPTLIDGPNYMCITGSQNTQYPGVISGQKNSVGRDGATIALPTALQTLAEAQHQENLKEAMPCQEKRESVINRSKKCVEEGVKQIKISRRRSAPSLISVEVKDDPQRRAQSLIRRVVDSSAKSVPRPIPQPEIEYEAANGPTHDAPLLHPSAGGD